MSEAIENLKSALQKAMAGRPKIGGFPYLAEVLRSAGVKRNLWSLPSCQSLYLTEYGSVAMLATPLITDAADVPRFDSDSLIAALRVDQAGRSTFPEFLMAAWQAGIVSYEVDFLARTVTYFGPAGESYIEPYPAVEL